MQPLGNVPRSETGTSSKGLSSKGLKHVLATVFVDLEQTV
jgi:hypothetical protein